MNWQTRQTVGVALAILLVPVLVLSQDRARSRNAADRLEEVDDDFALQGEYMGRVSGLPGCERVGLQVVALGDGKFDAVLLRGGLTGAGWDRRAKDQLTAARDEDFVQFENERWKIDVDGEAAALSAADGRFFGRLAKYHRISPTIDARPPANAVVLFDGSSTDHFEDAEITDEGLLDVGAVTKSLVRDFRLHLEFRTPYMPHARGQSRGNSGVYIQQRYEVQILDSFGLEGVENECGALYRQQRPSVNMCFPPLAWQTYDIYFRAARWDSNQQRIAPARITVLHNGEPIHLDYAIKDKTGGGKPESPEDRPILLQDHGNPIRFRNIWAAPWTNYVAEFDVSNPACDSFALHQSATASLIRMTSYPSRQSSRAVSDRAVSR